MTKSYGHRHGTVEGWGDEITQYYVVEDMLKLDPGQLMHLFESVVGQVRPDSGVFIHHDYSTGSKGTVEQFVAGLSDWFENNGETLVETVGAVVRDRGDNMTTLQENVEDGCEGIATWDGRGTD